MIRALCTKQYLVATKTESQNPRRSIGGHFERQHFLCLPRLAHGTAFGTRLGETGADAFTIMKLMGHSTVVVSQRYVHPSPEGIERGMERLGAFGKGKRTSRTVGLSPGTISELNVWRMLVLKQEQASIGAL
jgi:hypothetical protein